MRNALVFSLVFAACNGNNSINVKNTCSGDYDRLLGGLCDLLSRCPNVYPLAYSGRDQCKAILCSTSTCSLDVVGSGADFTFKLTQRMPTVNSSKVQACLDYLGSVSCDSANISLGSSSSSSGSSNGPCAGVFDDSSNNNNGSSDDCTSTSCGDGGMCVYGHTDVDMGLRTCAVCKSLPTMGQPCTGLCAPGLYCDEYTSTSSNTCQPPQADGATCYSNSTTNSPCQSGFCNFNTQKCDPAGHDGDPCTSSYDCRNNSCNAMSKCQSPGKPGDACTVSSDCADFTCDPNDHKCGLANGASCSSFGQACRGVCDSSTSLCVSAKADGASCNTDQECQSQFCADVSFSSFSRSCAEPCTNGCPSGQVCGEFSACIAPQANGADCDNDAQCTSGHCSPSGTCSDKPTIGGTCTDSNACFPIGYCDTGTCQKPKPPGSACTTYDSCLAPYACLGGICRMLNLSCAPASTGQQCAYLRVCDDQSYCDSTFTCRPRVGSGAACTSNMMCQGGSYCDQKCVPQLGAGANCDSDAQCQSGFFCVMSSSSSQGTCTAAPAGQACDQYQGPQCPDGYFCYDQKCVAGVGQKGASCSSSGPGCVAGLWCSSGTCGDRLAIGGSCDFEDDACLSGHCDRSSDVCLNSSMCVMP